MKRRARGFKAFPLFVVSFLISVLAETNNNVKSDNHRTKLSVLATIPLTGKEPANGKACTTAMQIVVDKANALAGFLDDYHVTMEVRDEGRNAYMSPRNLINFVEERDKPGGYGIPAPVTIGPSLSCQYTSPIGNELYLIHFSEFCAGQYLVNRQLWPNLYRIQMPGEYSVVAILLFMLRIGMWNQLGIFTYSLNANEYMMAKTLNARASENGIDVVHYFSYDDMTYDMVMAGKASGARVFALIYLQVAMCVRFLCLSYLAGMRAPHYVFLPQIFCYFTADSPDLQLPEGCSREMIYEQMKITFWAGVSPTNVIGSQLNTTLGYDLDWFEGEIYRRLKYSIPPDMDQRHFCHDTMLASLVTLDRSDKTLRRFYNMTLAEWQTRPKLAHKVVNESASTLDFYSIRIGRMKYSKRYELAQEDMWIMQWTDGRLRLLYRVQWQDKDNYDSMYNLSTYTMEKTSQPIYWMTKNGQPPKDLSHVDHFYDHYSLTTVIAILSLATASASFQCFLGILYATKKLPSTTYNHWQVDSLMAIGCVLLNGTAIFLVTGGYWMPNMATYCRIRVILPVLGLSIVNGILFLRISSLFRMLHVRWHNSPFSFRARARLQNNRNFVAASDWRHVDSTTVKATLAFVVLSSLALTVWLLGPTDDFAIRTMTSPITFDETNYSMYDFSYNSCSSNNQFYWLGSLAAMHAIMLAVSCIWAYELSRNNLDPAYATECKLCGLAILNATTIYFAVLLLAFITSGQNNLQITVLAVGAWVLSFSSSAIWLYPVWKRRRISNGIASRIRNSIDVAGISTGTFASSFFSPTRNREFFGTVHRHTATMAPSTELPKQVSKASSSASVILHAQMA